MAPEPRIGDLGIMASTDPVAIDKACLDLLKQTHYNGTQDLIDQIQRLEGENTIITAEKLGVGTTSYNLIDLETGEIINSSSKAIFCFELIFSSSLSISIPSLSSSISILSSISFSNFSKIFLSSSSGPSYEACCFCFLAKLALVASSSSSSFDFGSY